MLSIGLYAGNFTFYHDNDSFLGGDSEYISGLKLEYTYATEINNLEINWRGLSFIQQIFTPFSTGSVSPPLTERPYAGWLALGFDFGVEKKDNSKRLTVSIGITGKESLGSFVQESYHQLTNKFVPQGWDSQIDREITLNIFYNEDFRVFFYKKNNWYFEGWLGSFTALGNFQTSLGGQTVLRVGYYKDKIPTFGNFRLSHTSSFNNKRNKAISLYISTRVDYRWQYLPLDGLVFGDELVSDIEVNPFIVEYSAGLIVDWFRDYSLGVSYTWRSLEYKQQREHRPYISLFLSYSF